MFDEKTTREKWLDGLIEQLPLRPGQAAERPAIWGGEFGAAGLDAFLAAWDAAGLDMPWRLCEWISDIALERNASGAPKDPEYLEQMRRFGPGGDLQLRRYTALPGPREGAEAAESGRWLWRFVGPEATRLPVGCVERTEAELLEAAQPPFGAVSYWAQTGGTGLQREPRHTLLWGERRYHPADGKKVYSWHADRVGAAQLHYPGDWDALPEPPNRVQLNYDAYLRDGNVEAVWWTGLDAHEEVTR
jgi:hypothetical protein